MKSIILKATLGLGFIALSACASSKPAQVTGQDMITWLSEKDTAPCEVLEARSSTLLEIMGGQYRAVGKNAALAKALGRRTMISLATEKLERCSDDMDPAMRQSLLKMYSKF